MTRSYHGEVVALGKKLTKENIHLHRIYILTFRESACRFFSILWVRI